MSADVQILDLKAATIVQTAVNALRQAERPVTPSAVERVIILKFGGDMKLMKACQVEANNFFSLADFLSRD